MDPMEIINECLQVHELFILLEKQGQVMLKSSAGIALLLIDRLELCFLMHGADI